VVLSLQLPFAVIPLVHFTGSRARMGRFANPCWVQTLAWTVAVIIVALNFWLVSSSVGEWLREAGNYRWLVQFTAIPLAAGLFMLLLWIWLEPVLPHRLRGRAPAVQRVPQGLVVPPAPAIYSRNLVPLDHSGQDGPAIAHAASMARLSGATVYLVHVEEDVASQVYGEEASTAEVEAGHRYFNTIAADLRSQGIQTELIIHHSPKPAEEIIRMAAQIHPDLVVMGSHGHKGLKDIMLGTTINAVRHDLAVPLLLVRGKPGV
jgi:manganese transport protein